MRKVTLALTLAAFASLSACKKTGDGEYEVQKPTVGTTTDTLRTPTVEMKKDSINTPTVGTKPETLIVNKPVVGSKKTEVSVPTVKKP
ncbi:MAG TPA: hypothetical protein VKA84_27455 [Gemmatimonadaceae bacterium]|nr:hypothetical protein [Gemmatimonadaceae bacterium]